MSVKSIVAAVCASVLLMIGSARTSVQISPTAIRVFHTIRF